MKKHKLDDKKIHKSNFYKNKKLFNICDIDVHKILIFKNEPYGRKNSGLNGVDDVIRPLCIKLYKMVVYLKYFDSNNTMSFKIKDNGLLKKYTKI